MIKNFIKIALRIIKNQQIYIVLNVFSLTIGLASAILILLFIIHNLSYDKFHEQHNQIYRVYLSSKVNDIEYHQALTPTPLSGKINSEYPSVKNAVRVGKFGAWLVINDSIRYNEDNLLFADSTYFQIFTHHFLRGNPATALKNPNNIVLTKSTAERYFGAINPMGKSLKIEDDSLPYTVTGIIEDVPENSHLHFDLLVSLSTLNKYFKDIWMYSMFYTYILVDQNTNEVSLENEINQLVDKYVIPDLIKYHNISEKEFADGDDYYQFHLQKLTDIHLKSHLNYELEPNGDMRYIYIFFSLAILILVVACINFMNLATARASSRAKEVGIRKLSGSGQFILFRQFITESVILSFIALALALLFVELLLPVLNPFLGLELKLGLINNFYGFGFLILLTLITGVLAGSYPAFFISSFKTVDVLKGRAMSGIRNIRLRTVFVFVQFIVAIIIIILTFIIYSQWKFVQQKDLGFTKDHMLVIRRPDALKSKLEDFKKDILDHPDILAVTNTNTIPGRLITNVNLKVEESPEESRFILNQLLVNYDFKETFQVELVQGRFFSEKIGSDSFACIINERAVELFGLQEPVGKRLMYPGAKPSSKGSFEIIGVVKDFHYQTLESDILPLFIRIMPRNMEGFLTVRLEPGKDTRHIITFLRNNWERYTTEYPFVYFFLDNDLKSHYQYIINLGRIFLLFSVLSVFIACLGLFGLVSFTSSQRLREIGIRKALGASIPKVVLLLTKEVSYLILLATLFSWIIVYFIARWWLNEFSYSIYLNILYFFAATVIVLFVAIVTAIYQSYVSALRNPGEILKYE